MPRLRAIAAVVFVLAGLISAVPSVGVAHTAVVQPGDTLAAIAVRVGSTPDALARLNGIADANLVVAGTRLRIHAHGPGAAPAPASAAGVHVVRPGETLASIAAARGTTVARLARANGIADPNVITVGARLRLDGTVVSRPAAARAPAAATTPGTYTVRAGDTLASIAARLGTTSRALARANGIADPNLISVGTRLRAPSRSSAQPPPTTTATVPRPAPARSDIAGLLNDAAARHGVSAPLVRAVAWQESGWNQAAVSPVGARGVMQLMPDTADWAGPALLGRTIDPHQVEGNIDAGVAFLAYLQRETGDIALTLAAYNQGLTSVRRRGLFNETKRYVASVKSLVGRV